MPTNHARFSSSRTTRAVVWVMLACIWHQTLLAATGGIAAPRAQVAAAVAVTSDLPAAAIAADAVLQPGEASIFGPQKYVRTTGAKDEYRAAIKVPAWVVSPYRLIIENGEPNGANRVSSAIVSLNGTEVVDQDDFNRNAAGFSKNVTLTATTELLVVLASKPTSFLTINLAGAIADKTQPAITVAAPANGSSTNERRPRLVVRYADLPGTGEPAASGVDTATLSVKLDDVDRTALFTRRSDEASAELQQNLALTEGLHTIRASVKDRAGNVAEAVSQFRVDVTPPVVAVPQPVRGSYLATATPAVRVTFADETALAGGSLKITINGADRTSEFTLAADQATWNAAAALPAGANEVVATIRDVAGNVSTASTSFNVDLQKPALAIAAPAANAVHGAPMVDVALSFSDDQAVDPATLAVTVDGTALPMTVAGDRATAKTAALADGAHALVASIADRAGNATTVTTPFRVDTGVPQLAVLEPAAGAILKTNQPRIAVSFSDAQGVDPATVRFTINGVDRTALFTLTAGGSPAVLDGTLALPEGTIEVTASIRDLAGNSGSTTSSFFVDTIVPAGAVELNALTNAAAPHASLRWSDGGSGVDPATLAVTVDGLAVTALFAKDAGGAMATLATTPPLADGPHELRATFRDRAGNETALVQAFTIDTIAPAVQFTAPRDNSFVKTASPQVVLGYADQSGTGVDPANVRIFLTRGTAAETDVTAFFTIGAAQATGVFPETAKLGEGTHRLRAVIRDRAGNESSASVSFEVDTVAPAFEVTAPAPGSFTSDSTPAVAIRFADERSGVDRATLAITIDGVDRTSLFAVTETTATAQLTAPLGEGVHAIAVALSDRAGNAAAAAPATFTVDTIKPVATVVAPLANAYTAAVTPVIDLALSDGAGSGVDPAYVQILIDGFDRTSEFTITATSARSALTAPLAEGAHTIAVSILDWAANAGNATSTFTIDTRPPLLDVLDPLPGAYAKGAAIPVSGTVADASPVTVKVGSINATVQTGTFTAAGVPLPAVEGDTTLRVVATDAAGNAAEKTVTVRVDRTSPTVAITAPANGAVVRGPSVEVTGTFADSAPVIVEVNDALATLGTGTFNALVGGADGPLRITAKATDAAGNVATAAANITVDATAPVITVTSPATSLTTASETFAIAGTVADLTEVTLKIGDTLVPVAGGAFTHTVTVAEGTNSFTLLATDAAGNSATRTVVITGDRTLPTITIATPAADAVVANLPIVVRGTITDTTAAKVTVNGVAAEVIGDAWEANFATLPAEGPNTFTIVAVDAAGNQATATRSIILDLNAPIVTITTPANGTFTSAGTTTITGTIRDVTLQTLLANGIPAVSTPNGNGTGYTYVATAIPLVEGDNALVVVATDATTRTGQAQVTVTRDSIAPAATIAAPDQLTKNATATAVVNATDNLGVANVVLTLGGAPLATFSAPPFEKSFTLPATAVLGDVVTLVAVVTDRAGNTATASKAVRVVSDGVIVGQVLSDLTSLPVEGARVLVASGAIAGQTDARGRYSFTATDAIVQLTVDRADGSVLPVDRSVSVASGTGTVPVDARLTPLAPPVTIGASGGTLAGESVTVTIPAGAVSAPAPLTLTVLSPQGLPNLLPLGWSPIAAFHVGGTASFAAPVTASVTTRYSGAMQLAAYRRAMRAWVLVQRDVNPASFTLPAPDAYALVVLDSDAGVSIPAAGEVLPGVLMVPIPANAASTGEVVPPILPPTGGEATGIVMVQSATPLPSGTVAHAVVSETYTLANGDAASAENRTEDIVLFRLPAREGAAVSAEVPVVPSRSFANGELTEGRVHLDIYAGREGVRGRTGGNAAVTVTNGNASLSVAQSSLPEDTAVAVTHGAVSPFVPSTAALTPFAEVVVDLSGRTLATAAELSVATTPLVGAETFLVARVERVGGVAKLVVVALAELIGGRAVTRPHAGLPGILTEGRYVFYRTTAPIAFVKGTATASGAPVAAIVQPENAPFAAIADAQGRFLVAALAGSVTLRATVPQTSLAGTASVSAAAGATAQLDVVLAGATSTATVTPANGETHVPVSAQLDIVATAPLNDSTVNATSVRLVKDGGAGVPVRFVFSGSGRSVAVIPRAQLEPATRYTLHASGVADTFGGYVTIEPSSFTTMPDAPPQVDVEKVTFTFPDANGNVTVSAPAGSLAPGSTVMIVNTGNGIVVSFTVGNDGSFSGTFPASIDDRLLVTITDPAGNFINFERSKFVAADGSGRTAIGAGGGTVEGPNGTQIRIPEGALDKGVTFRLESFGPDLYPERPEGEGLHWGGGLHVISEQMPKLKKEGDLVFPKPPDAPDGAFYYVYRRITGPNGAVAFEFVDHAFPEGTGPDAKIVTASYPNIGWQDSVVSWETAAAVGGIAFGLGQQIVFELMYAWDALWPGVSLKGLITGQVTRPTWTDGANEVQYLPVEGAVITSEAGYAALNPPAPSGANAPRTNSTGATATFARTDDTGVYGLVDATYFGGVKTVVLNSPEVQKALAIELDPETSRARKLPIEYRNIATASFALQPQQPPPPAPEIEVHVMSVRNGVRRNAGSFVTMGQELLIGFKSNVGTGFKSFTATVQGKEISLVEDNYSGTLKMTRIMDTEFSPIAADTYTITATVVPLTGAPVTVSHSFLVIGGGNEENNVSRSGPPQILHGELKPKNGATDVPVTVLPFIAFTEPVKKVDGNVKLIDSDGQLVPAIISAVAVDNRGQSYAVQDLHAVDPTTAVTSITVRPVRGLKFGTKYRLRLEPNTIEDFGGNKLGGQEIYFETFKPASIGRSPEAFDSTGIVVVEQSAYVAKRTSPHGRVAVFNVSTPQAPREVSQRAVAGQTIDIDAEATSFTGGRMVVAGSGINFVTYGPSNLYIYEPQADQLEVIGAASLTQGTEEGTILRFDVKGSLAYVTTSAFTKSLVVVDLRRNVEAYKARVAQGGQADIAKSLILKGVGWGFRESVVKQTDLFDSTGQRIRLYGIKAHDFVIDGVSRTLAVIAGSRPLVIADPERGSTPLFAAESLSLPEGPNVPAPGSISLATQLTVAELGGRTLAFVGGYGTARFSDASIVMMTGSVIAVVDISNPRAPVPLSFTYVPSYAGDLVVKDRFLIAGSNPDAFVLSLQKPEHPLFVGRLPDLGQFIAVQSPDLLYSTSWGNMGVNVGRFAPLQCEDLAATPQIPSYVASSEAIKRGDWTMRLAVSEDDGLVIRNLHLGKRLMARSISLPYVKLEAAGKDLRCQLGNLPAGQACNDPTARVKLVALKIPEEHEVGPITEGFAIEASYLIDKLDGETAGANATGKECCLLVTQRYEFGAEGFESCEASDEFSCARFKPLVSYRFLAQPGVEFKTFNSVQRFDFKPPTHHAVLGDPTADPAYSDGNRNMASFFRDCEGFWETVLDCMRNFSVTSNPYGNPVETEKDLTVIRDGKMNGEPHEIDNLHLGPWEEHHHKIDGPTPTGHPGCAECVHMHWRWGSILEPDSPIAGAYGISSIIGARVSPRFDNFGGQPIIPGGSNQDVRVALTQTEPGDLDPPGDFGDYARGGQPLAGGVPITVWYSGTGHIPADTFFHHGIFFGSLRVTMTNAESVGTGFTSGTVYFSINNGYGQLPLTWSAELLDPSTREVRYSFPAKQLHQASNFVDLPDIGVGGYILRVFVKDATGWQTKRERFVHVEGYRLNPRGLPQKKEDPGDS